MSLIPVDAEYHYVQDNAPSSANAGDVWLDTSVNPPVAKIYADVGNGLEWIQDQSSDRIATNLDAKVSNAGQGVDWASKTEEWIECPDGSATSVTGSGYIFHITTTDGSQLDFYQGDDSHFSVDSVEYFGPNTTQSFEPFNSIIPFDNSFEMYIRDNSAPAVIHYVLD